MKMKKDKEWLIEKMKDEELESEYVHENYYSYENVLIADDAYALIDQLEEPEITEEQAWEVIRGNPEIKEFGEILADQMKYRALERKIKLFTNLDMDDFIEELTKNGLNKNKLVEIPQFVTDWIRSFASEGGNKWDLMGVVTNMTSANVSKADTDIFNWLNDGNRNLFMNAITNGYTIEPPKTLQVIVKNYDSTVYKTELPEDEAMKLIEGWKGYEKS